MSFVLVLIHVLCGIFWAGGAIVAGLFIMPSIVEAGPAGGAVMAGLLKRKMPIWLTWAGGLNVLTGLGLFHFRFSALGGGMTWVTTPEGLVLTLGGLLGLAGFAMGVFIQRPTAMKIGALGAQIGQGGGKPSPEQAVQMKALQTKLVKIARVAAWHLLVSAALMASHRLAATL